MHIISHYIECVWLREWLGVVRMHPWHQHVAHPRPHCTKVLPLSRPAGTICGAPRAEHAFKLHCYTFGAPRTGNHTFAHMYNAAVPETWHIINNDDVVTQAGKFINLYKRAGQRVLVNRLGDLVVRPSYAETAIRRVPGGGCAVPD